MNVEPMTVDAARQAILATGGRIFGATVIKRQTGEIRTFNARIFEDTGKTERDQRNMMLTVVDIHRTQELRRATGDPSKLAYRTISLEGVLAITCAGRRIEFHTI